ncbi:hypothetical protein BJ165DRAFT_1417496 [Panaeolus papilionaceus]|nr:hypothetical protein BJ165DRAFT_1417496 [Panaeolus papilionaceus]
MAEIAEVMSAYCQDLAPNAVEETGCAVCGQLTLRRLMSPLTENVKHLHVLVEPGATRSERYDVFTPCTPCDGPVLAPNLTQICTNCKVALEKDQRPKLSLANWLWLGEVPPVLQNLTLAEQVLISRVRHNYCVVRVSNGHSKMIANAIAFEHPSVKIYEALPVTQSELDDVLSVVFTGKVRPSHEDLRRTPVLVRRIRIQNALEWLKINHKDYADLNIDYGVLNTYPLDDVPIGFLYREKGDNEGNTLDAEKSVFDSIEEVGTVSGPCPFTVHGLGADRKAIALQHMVNGGSSLAIGHSEQPQSLYNNPSLYPQMFPWLFPYGYGGDLLSFERHLKWLMLYYDKRFQRDAVFCIIAFNHMSVKQSSSGSYVMAIAQEISSLDPTDLTAISERLRDPKAKRRPENDGEKGWFKVLDHIEYVGSHVGGSLAMRKYQRNEVWSLIGFEGTPNWFVTISPSDAKHPLCIYFADESAASSDT